MGALSRLRQGFGAPGLRRAIGIAATLLLLTLLSWPALAAGRPQSRLDATLATRAGQPGVSRVIVRSTGATDVTAKIRAHRGQAGQRLALVDGYVAEVPNDALEALAAADGVAGVHLDRPVGALLAPGAGNGARQRPGRFIERTRLHWRRRRCRGDRLGAHVVARRPGARRRGPRAGRPARRGLCRLHGLDQPGRRQLRSRHARRRNRRGIGSRQRRRVRRRGARCASAGAEGARRARAVAMSATSSARSTSPSPTARGSTCASSTCRLARRCSNRSRPIRSRWPPGAPWKPGWSSSRRPATSARTWTTRFNTAASPRRATRRGC